MYKLSTTYSRHVGRLTCPIRLSGADLRLRKHVCIQVVSSKFVIAIIFQRNSFSRRLRWLTEEHRLRYWQVWMWWDSMQWSLIERNLRHQFVKILCR